jgi:uncharacterized phage protein gp47/JayE
MNADALRYLAEHTDITYLAEGSIARGLVEATNLEIARVQQFIETSHSNVFINSAQGIYLDLIGEHLGVKRLGKSAASATVEDNNVKFSVVSGTLGDKFSDAGNANNGLIPAGITIKTSDSSITFKVSSAVSFPRSLTEVFVSVVSDSPGASTNVGRGRLTLHDGPVGVNVTNLKPITNGSEAENDRSYRFRLSNAIAAFPTSNETSIRLALAGIPDIARVELKEYARGAGTFDVLLVPVGNNVSRKTFDISKRAVESVAAFGISSAIREPTYIRFKVTIQLIPQSGVGAGTIDSNKIATKDAILDYFETIPMGGEFIINRLRAAVIDAVSPEIKDIKILDLCLNGRPRSIRNIKLRPEELFTPDIGIGQSAIEVI